MARATASISSIFQIEAHELTSRVDLASVRVVTVEGPKKGRGKVKVSFFFSGNLSVTAEMDRKTTKEVITRWEKIIQVVEK